MREVKEMERSGLWEIVERVKAGWSRGELVRDGYDPEVVDRVLDARDRALEKMRKAPREEARRSIDMGSSMDPAREREAYRVKRRGAPAAEETASPHEFQTVGSLLRHDGAPSHGNQVLQRARSTNPKWAHYELLSIEEANWREWPCPALYVYRILPGTTFEPLTKGQQKELVKGGTK